MSNVLKIDGKQPKNNNFPDQDHMSVTPRYLTRQYFND